MKFHKLLSALLFTLCIPLLLMAGEKVPGKPIHKKSGISKKEKAAVVVKIKTVKGPTKGKCGAFDWQVAFELSGKAPNKGYIIQKINIEIHSKKCDGTVDIDYSKTFYEAWAVDSGATTSTVAIGGVNDMYIFPGRPNTRGTACIKGNLKFMVMNALPAGWITDNPATNAGILPSSLVAPPGWVDAGGTVHNICSTWDCCDGKDTTTVVTNPVIVTTVTTCPVTVGPINPLPTTSQIILSIPEWTSTYSAADQIRFKQAIQSLSTYTDSEIMQGIDWINNTYEDSCNRVAQETKIFLAVKSLYAVPDMVSQSDAKYFGMWVRGDADMPGTFNPLWPLSQNGSELEVTGENIGASGLGYNGKEEMEYLAQRYPRRKIIKVEDIFSDDIAIDHFKKTQKSKAELQFNSFSQTSNAVYVQLRSLKAQSLNWQLRDLNGRHVANGYLQIGEGISSVSIPTGNLTNGIYLLQFQNTNILLTRKIMISR